MSNLTTTDNESDIIISEEVTDASTMYSQELALINSEIATARRYPRNLRRSLDNAITTVTLDVETASTCTYSIMRAGKAITGATVHLAKILAQNWGNMRVEAKVVNVDAKHVTSQAIAFDLENNLAIKVEVKRSIVGKNGRFSDDMITVTGNAANAIALRNAILNVIPKAIVDKVYNEAIRMISGDLSDNTKLIAKRKKIFDGFLELYGVKEWEVLQVIGRAAIDHVTPDDIVTLIGIGTAIKDGDSTVEQTFRKKGDKLKTDVTKEAEVEPMNVIDKESKKNHQPSKNGKLL